MYPKIRSISICKNKEKLVSAVWFFAVWFLMVLFFTLLFHFYPLWVRIVVAVYVTGAFVVVGVYRDLSSLTRTLIMFSVLAIGIGCLFIPGLYKIYNPVTKWPIPMMLLGLLTVAYGSILYLEWLRQR